MQGQGQEGRGGRRRCRGKDRREEEVGKMQGQGQEDYEVGGDAGARTRGTRR